MLTHLAILQTKALNVKGVMLKLALAIMGPTVPCWDEELHLLQIKKWLEDRVSACCDLEGTSNIIH